MIGSGVTTVQHLQVWVPRPLENIERVIGRVLDAYRDIGMRVSFSYGLRDQNRIVYESDAEFLKRLPDDLAAELGAFLEKATLPLDEQIGLFEDTYAKYNGRERARIQLGPTNLHWCSDEALAAVRAISDKFQVPMHMHLVESAYQKEYARRRGGGTAVDYLREHGMLGPLMTLGHSTWINESDIAIAADTGTHICHNASSNLRLRSGIRAGQPARGAGRERRARDRRGRHQRRPRHAPRDAYGSQAAPRAWLRRQRADVAAGAAHGDRERRSDDAVRCRHRHARDRQGGRHGGDELARYRIPVSRSRHRRLGDRRDRPSRKVVGRQDGDCRRRTDSARRLFHARRQGRHARRTRRVDGGRRGPGRLRRTALSRNVLPYVKRFYDGYLDAETRDPFYAFNARG